MSSFERASFILIGDELRRVNIEEDENGVREIILDLHGLSRYQAKKIINGIILLFRNEFILTLIHGYIHGTALKTMILTDIDHPRIKAKETECFNCGVTHLVVV